MLNKKYDLDVETHGRYLRYRFGGGEKKVATLRDVLAAAVRTGRWICVSPRFADEVVVVAVDSDCSGHGVGRPGRHRRLQGAGLVRREAQTHL